MKLAVVTVATLTMTLSATAFECPFGEEGHLVPVSWSAKDIGQATTVRVGVKNTFNKAVRMVDGGVWFVDGLGQVSLDHWSRT